MSTLILEPEETEGQTFEEILHAARERLPEICSAWTNYNPADSASALLELLAFMTEAQRFHLEQFGRSHEFAFLHLLGVQPRGRRPAEAYVQIRGMGRAAFLPRGFQVSAEELVFEATFGANLERDGILVDRPETPFYPFGEKGEGVYEIRLAQGLAPQMEHMLYFAVRDEYPISRNPVVPEEFVPLTRLVLDYHDGKGWHDCRICEDSTYGMLQTGMVAFKIAGAAKEGYGADMPDGTPGFFLRLRAEGEYDTVPVLTEVSFNRIPFVQKETRIECDRYRLIPGEGDTLGFSVATRPAMEGELCVYYRTEQGLRRIPAAYSSLPGGARYVSCKKELFGEDQAPEAWLVAVCPGTSGEDFCFAGNGLPGQEYFLPVTGILGEEFRLWVEESPGYYMPWTGVPDLAGAGRYDRVYCLDEEEGIVRFGDGRQGMMPCGRIMVVACAVCAGRGGNVQRSQIRGNLNGGEAGLYGEYQNPAPAAGGQDAESPEECLQRYQRSRRRKERAVTEADYEEVIRQTPGLRIRRVKVFPAADKENGFDAMVQPYTDGRRTLRGRAYEENIMRVLHRKRMLGTSVSLKKPEYIRIFLQLEARVRSRYPEAEKRLRERIFEYFEENMDFGTSIVYSRVFGYIDMLPEVAGIRALEIHAAGREVERDENRDLHLPVYGIARLDEVELRCIWTDEI